MRRWFRFAILGILLGQLALLGYIARVDYQIRAMTALSYIELSSR